MESKKILLIYFIGAVFYACVNSTPSSFIIDIAGKPCLRVELDSTINIRYQNTSKNYDVASFNVTGAVNQNGLCAKESRPNSAEIVIEMENGANLTLEFIADKFQNVYISKANLTFQYSNLKIFKNPLKTEFVSASVSFNESFSRTTEYFECDSTLNVDFSEDVKTTTTYFKFQAFNLTDGNYSLTGNVCQNNESTTSVGSSTEMSTETTHVTTETAHTTDVTTETTGATDITTETGTTEMPTTTKTGSTSTATTELSSTTTSQSPPLTTTAKPVYPTHEVKGPDGNVCLIVKLNFTLTLLSNPEKKESPKRTFRTDTVDVRSNGTCGENFNLINLMWNPVKTTNDEFVLTLTYTKEGAKLAAFTTIQETKDTYYLSSMGVKYVINKHTFPDSNSSYHDPVIVSVGNLTSNPKITAGKSFRCNAQLKTDIEGNEIIMDHMLVEAFRNSTNTNFDDADVCAEDNDKKKSNNIVPIVVGVVLAALVIVVLIAYLIGRRRHRVGYDNI